MPGPLSTPQAVSFSASGGLSAGVVGHPFWMAPYDLAVLGAIAYVGTAPTTSAIILNFQVLRAVDGSTVNLYDDTAVRPTIAATKHYSFAEVTDPALPYSPYALDNPTPGGAVNAPATKAVTHTPIPPLPDLNTVLYAGDLVSLDIVQIGSGTAGSDLLGALLYLKN